MRRLPLGIGWLGLLSIAAGCGSNVENLLLQSAAALGRTYFDLLLTDLANTLADASAGDDSANDNGNDNTNDNTNGNDNGNGGPVVGDPVAGEAVFASNGCGSCHCADASGGCALNAPSLIGVSEETIRAKFGGGDPHPTSPSLSNQQLADLAAYLGSL